MKVTQPTGVDETHAWGLVLPKTYPLETALELAIEKLQEAKKVWRSLRIIDSGDAHNSVCQAFTKLPDKSRNKAFAFALYALQTEFALHISEAEQQLNIIMNDDWDGLFSATLTLATPEKDRS